MNIHIFGAASGIGKWLTEYVFSQRGNVFAYDIDKKIDDEFSNHAGITPCHIDLENVVKSDILKPFAGKFNDGDLFILAIPESALDSFVKSLKLHFPAVSLCAVSTSVQHQAVKLLSKQLGKDSVVGFHPLFGPSVKNTHGQLVALCEYNSNIKTHEEFQNIIIRSGLQVSKVTSKQHDEYMSYVQGLTHFILLSFLNMISKEDHSLEDLMLVKTPPFQFLSAFSSRLLMGAPLTYAAIQNTTDAATMRKKYLKSIIELDKKLGVEDVRTISKNIEAIREPFSSTLLTELSQFSILSVNAVQDLEESFYKSMKDETLFIFRNKRSEKVRVGKIDRIGSRSLDITEITSRIPLKGNELIPFPFNDNAVKEYSKDGISIKRSSNIKINKSKIIVFSEKEKEEYLTENLLYIDRVLEVPNPLNIEQDVFEEWVPRFVPEVKKCIFVEAHQKRGELPKVKLMVRIHPAYSSTCVKSSLRAFTYGFKI